MSRALSFSILATALVTFPSLAADAPDGASAGDLLAHMHTHFDRISQIQQAVIRGDLEATREPAAWLADHSEPAGLEQHFARYVTAMREAAGRTLRARRIDEAAAGVSTLAMACAECHQGSGVADQFAVTRPPPDEPGVKAHMVRHQWAADRLWEGLIGPSDRAWNAGVDLLVEVPLHPADVSAEPDSELRVLTRRIHELGAQGYIADTPGDRADLYAEFLSACAACHTRLGVSP